MNGDIKMKVNEIFRSVQGEGPAMGDVATFVRLSGCNLMCEGCDAVHQDGINMSVSDVVEVCRSMKNDVIIITGGEPFIQPEVYDLISALDDAGFVVDVETNGTQSIMRDVTWNVRYFVVSPKRGYPVSKSVLNQSFKYWKFVIGPLHWMWSPEEVLCFIDRYDITKSSVYLMPYDAADNARMVWDKCVEFGLNYSDRLQCRVGRK